MDILHSPFAGSDNAKFRQSFQSTIRERLQRALKLIDMYSAVINDGTLESELQSIADNKYQLEEIRETATLAKVRIGKNELSDSDTDILLSLAHLVSFGNEGKDEHEQWNEPHYYSSVFIDEVQDFTEVQVFLMAEQANPKRRAVTAVGDFRQQLKYGTVANIGRCFPRASAEDIKPIFLSENKRQSQALVYFSSRFRTDILGDRIEDFKSPEYPDNIECLSLWKIGKEKIDECIKNIILATSDNFSLAVICPSKSVAKWLEEKLHDELGAYYRETQVSEKRDLCRPYYIHFTTALDVKGLEFDSVVVALFDQFDLSDSIQANSAYVAVTRPKKELHIIGEECLSSGPFAKFIVPEFKARIRSL